MVDSIIPDPATFAQDANAMLDTLAKLHQGISDLQKALEGFKNSSDFSADLAKNIGVADNLATIFTTLANSAGGAADPVSTLVTLAVDASTASSALAANAGGAAGAVSALASGSSSASASASVLTSNVGAASTAVSGLSSALSGAAILFIADRVMAIAKAHGEYREAVKSAAEAQSQANLRLEEGISAAADQAAKFAGQGAVTQTVLDALAQGTGQLTESQKQHYASMLGGSEEYLKAQIAIGVREQERYGQTRIDLEGVRTKLGEVRAAHGELKAELEAASKPVAIPIDPELLPKLKEVRENLGKVSSEDLANLASRSREAFGQTREAIDEAAKAFPALTGAALESVMAMDPRFKDLIATHKELAGAVEAIRAEQYKRLGVDVNEVLTGIDTKAKDLLATFQSLASDPDANPKLLTAAFQELLKTLNSEEELAALKESLGQINIKGFDIATTLGQVEEKLKTLPSAADPAAKAMADAFSFFGLKTREELEATAKKAEENFALISTSGQASAKSLDKAFADMATASVAAAAAMGQASAESQLGILATQARTEAQKQTLASLATQYQITGATATRALTDIKNEIPEVIKEHQKQLSAIDAVNAAYEERLKNPTDPRALLPTTKGGAISMTSLDERAVAVTGESRTALEILFQRLANQIVNNPGRGRVAEEEFEQAVSTFLQGGDKAEDLRNKILGIDPKQARTTRPPPSMTGPGNGSKFRPDYVTEESASKAEAAQKARDDAAKAAKAAREEQRRAAAQASTPAPKSGATDPRPPAPAPRPSTEVIKVMRMEFPDGKSLDVLAGQDDAVSSLLKSLSLSRRNSL
ncbi:hypothetical protein D0B54_02380 [Solimonas sp. K1W22B-7]|uniref:hypothetical protein n=1 Tax=Solimonas sp. K1W22B-7 TaxID=2303331 RepID=UPI000E335800|nr:hypothetical protein [Solimonas sp. K1W22B-7]AXQ27588.1 hypothetical protein D0B54_02380 [Solimonas sp. K1W22B-7]